MRRGVSEDPIPLVGRALERQQIIHAIERRESLLVLGAAGSGKSRLLQSAETELAGGTRLVRIPQCGSLHDLLVTLARRLVESGRWDLAAISGEDERERWLLRQTSVHLKGLLWQRLEAEPCVLLLDGVSGASFPLYRFFQRLYFVPGMTLVVAARDAVQLGPLARLFWDSRRTLQVKPLPVLEAQQVFELAADHFGLRHLSLEDFRDKVLDSAKGNPGQIVEMCRLAAEPQYVTGRTIKFSLVRIDTMTKYLGSG